MVYIFLAEGFEESEAVAPADILRRAGAEVQLVGVGSRVIRGSHGIALQADMTDDQVTKEGLEMIVLPGGMPGTHNLEQSPAVQSMIAYAFEKGIWVGAICAAPSILGHKEYLKGRHAVCYPGYEKDLVGAELAETPVCVDGNLITANGPGAAFEFGLHLAASLKGVTRAESIRAAMQLPPEK